MNEIKDCAMTYKYRVCYVACIGNLEFKREMTELPSPGVVEVETMRDWLSAERWTL